MLLTPDEAKTKWCPQRPMRSRQSEYDCCMADGCAAWRWAAVGAPTANGTVDYRKSDKGYCGLAGRLEIAA